MYASKIIEHKGVVKSICADSIIVNILTTSACTECHAKGVCSIVDMQDKDVEVLSDNRDKYSPGEEVNVGLKQSLGFRALFLGYILPFIIVMVTLILLKQFTSNELYIGLTSLLVLAPYYWVLFLHKKKYNKKYTFTINKIPS